MYTHTHDYSSTFQWASRLCSVLTSSLFQLLAPCFNKEKLQRWDIMATMVIFAGATLAVVFGSHSSPSYTLDDLKALYKDPLTGLIM